MSKKGRYMLKQGALTVVSLFFAALLLLLVQKFAFGMFRVTSETLSPTVEKGQHVLVNKLRRHHIGRGDLIAFRRDSAYLGVVTHLPGDTLHLDSLSLPLPTGGCPICHSTDCQPFVVKTGNGFTVIRRAEIVGSATPLSFLPRR